LKEKALKLVGSRHQAVGAEFGDIRFVEKLRMAEDNRERRKKSVERQSARFMSRRYIEATRRLKRKVPPLRFAPVGMTNI
jgi:hypothetical protein